MYANHYNRGHRPLKIRTDGDRSWVHELGSIGNSFVFF